MFEEADQTPAPTTSNSANRWFGLVAGCFIVLIFSLVAYSAHERSNANRLAAQKDEMAAMLKDTRTQMDALNARLNSISQPALAVQEAPKPSPVWRRPAKAVTAHRRASDGAQWKKFQSQLDTQGQAIESTRQDLANTRTELQDSIARTHGEVVLLQKKGERNYYEFDLDKSKQFSHAGPVGISLRKANTKQQYADLKLLIEDAELSKKHVNVYEPVRFYPGEDQQSVELVINSVRKNHIHGYISLPKYSSKDLVAAGPGNGSGIRQEPSIGNSGIAASTAPNKNRQRLEIPR